MQDVSVLAVVALLAASLGGAGCSSEESVDAGPPSMQQSELAAPGVDATAQPHAEEGEEK